MGRGVVLHLQTVKTFSLCGSIFLVSSWFLLPREGSASLGPIRLVARPPVEKCEVVLVDPQPAKTKSGWFGSRLSLSLFKDPRSRGGKSRLAHAIEMERPDHSLVKRIEEAEPRLSKVAKDTLFSNSKFLQKEIEEAPDLNTSVHYIKSIVLPKLKFRSDKDVLLLLSDPTSGFKTYAAVGKSTLTDSPSEEDSVLITYESDSNQNPVRGLHVRFFRPNLVPDAKRYKTIDWETYYLSVYQNTKVIREQYNTVIGFNADDENSKRSYFIDRFWGSKRQIPFWHNVFWLTKIRSWLATASDQAENPTVAKVSELYRAAMAGVPQANTDLAIPPFFGSKDDKLVV